MPGRQKTGTKNGKMGRSRPSSPSGAHPPPSRQQRGYTTTTQDRKTNPINPKSSTGNFQNIASTAAGVAAGSVVGHVIGNVLSSGIGHGNSVNAGSSSDYSNVTEEICSPEIRQFFECASKNEDLDTCKSFHNTWFECQKRYSQHRSQA
ncbi:coiled-coil-helix-coiled-coil-helix domain-containing protein 10, mitochondrial-like isoform X1 [Vespula pensylvanica]|uniref:coiled-coil-helix-coiled-coil-helix domain-containing protein 10, mitochondrial-like isoform X1 n=1 Tax=Vespula pensylvanica TaxID=30213 RepID=UPI001CB9E772|nr:coiled-coil-helix-coiled-coil-helix domain-containing protein 10, mitochondrial-like isoform X1 [Vespula pensylvanica]